MLTKPGTMPKGLKTKNGSGFFRIPVGLQECIMNPTRTVKENHPNHLNEKVT